MHNEYLHPYIFSGFSARTARLCFMVKFVHWFHAHAQLCSYLSFTDETHFSCDEMIYIRSTHLWAVENLRMTVKSIIGNQLIGP
jgi:hypothetical protein